MRERKMIPLAIPNLIGNERKYLNECIDTTFVSSVGTFVTRFEEMVAVNTGTKYAAATSAGTTAIHMALVACGVQTDNIVIIPSFTFIASANAISHCKAIPWCIDIDRESWTMSTQALKVALDSETIIINNQVLHKKSGKRVAAIMPVYTFGNTPDMDNIRKIADEYNLPIIADAAAAIGAIYKGKKIGELADATAISFNGNKTITAGGGGMVVSNNKNIIDLIHHISSTARISQEYDHDMIGYNYRITNLQAAVGCAQMEMLNQFIEKKRSIRKYYGENFKNIDGVNTFPEPAWGLSACWFSGLILEKERFPSVKEICTNLKENGIEARSFWKPIHLQEPYKECICSDVTLTNEIWNRIITLPCSTGITNEELKYVCKVVKGIIEL